MSKALRERTAAAIIDGAAAIMAERGDTVSMNDIASVAGVSRATLYRYFPNRESLLHQMAMTSIEELAPRIADANLQRIPVEQAIARLVRGFVAVGSKYVALSAGDFDRSGDHPNVDALLTEPVRALFRRGIADGTLRADLDPELMLDLFSGLIKSALETTSRRRAGVEEVSAAVTTIFLNGTHLTSQRNKVVSD